jgi:hypothetical protein
MSRPTRRALATPDPAPRAVRARALPWLAALALACASPSRPAERHVALEAQGFG